MNSFPTALPLALGLSEAGLESRSFHSSDKPCFLGRKELGTERTGAFCEPIVRDWLCLPRNRMKNLALHVGRPSCFMALTYPMDLAILQIPL